MESTKYLAWSTRKNNRQDNQLIGSGEIVEL